LLRREALSAIAIGNVILAVVMVLNGTIGARLHVSFPVINRSSFGFWFSYFSVISRVILSMFWFGVQVIICCIRPQFDVLTDPLQTYTGGECVYQVTKLIVF
jgi:NCS1 family nucleobase:cation symporter-1